MTVRELREALAELPEGAEVLFVPRDYDKINSEGVRVISKVVAGEVDENGCGFVWLDE